MSLVQSSNANSADSMDIVIHPPNSTEAVLAAGTFPYDRLMESWAVVASTLPLWDGRKNVTITYSPLEGVDPSESFLDTVTFNKVKSGRGKEPSEVIGVDVHEKSSAGSSTSGGEAIPNGLRFKWDGKALLSVSSAKWQVLGFFLAQDTMRREEDWVVTYFASTLMPQFTPAGLDIYVREPENFGKEKIQKLIAACRLNKDETVRKVSQDFFEIPRD